MLIKNISTQQLPYSQTIVYNQLTISSQKNMFSLLQLNNDLLLRKYTLSLQDYRKQAHLLEWRKNVQSPIPRIHRVSQFRDLQTGFQFTTVFCDHISKTLNQIPNFSIQQIIYCISEMILGYQQILLKIGYVVIESRYCGVNVKGELLVWINNNLSVNLSEMQSQRLYSEKEIIIKIISILQHKSKDKNHPFFIGVKKVNQFKFKNVLEFIIKFKNKNNLIIVPKINLSSSQNLVTSNVFSVKNQQIVNNIPVYYEQSQSYHKSLQRNFSLKVSETFKASPTNSQFLSTSRLPPVSNTNILQKRFNDENRFSLVKNTTPNNITKSINNNNEKGGVKINFSYSQKRDDVYSPAQSGILKDFASSDRNMIFNSNILSDCDKIKEFTLEDKKEQNSQRLAANEKSQKVIGQTNYQMNLIPQSNNSILLFRKQDDLKKSHATNFSQQSNPSNKNIDQSKIPYNNSKTSMTTNHRSAITQSFQSLGASSNSEEFLKGKKNILFISNNSTFTITKHSNCELDYQSYGNLNNAVQGTDFCYQHQYNNQHLTENNIKKPSQMQMYTFGGLITTKQQQGQQSSISKHPSSVDFNDIQSQQSNLNIFQINNQTLDDDVKMIKSPQTNHKIYNTTSIQELYNNLYFFTSDKKSMVVDENSRHLYSPNNYLESYETSNNNSPLLKKNIDSQSRELIVLQNGQQIYLPEDRFKALQTINSNSPVNMNKNSKSLLSPRSNFQNNLLTTNMNQWKGIKGLLNQSNIHDLKQSFHCGPQIRAPVNIKLDLLDKFGREIGQSIIPNQQHGFGSHVRLFQTHSKPHPQELNQSIDLN